MGRFRSSLPGDRAYMLRHSDQLSGLQIVAPENSVFLYAIEIKQIIPANVTLLIQQMLLNVNIPWILPDNWMRIY